jgi:PAS domain S-box-containing protein
MMGLAGIWAMPVWGAAAKAGGEIAGGGISGGNVAGGGGIELGAIWPVLLGAGLALAVIMLVRSMYQQWQTAGSLKLSQARLQQALDSAGYAPWDWHIGRRQLTISDTWGRMLGYAPGELEPSPQLWAQLVHPEDLDRVIDRLHAHLDGTTEHYADDYRLRGRDGQYIWVHISGAVVERTPNGQPVRISGVQQDITWRKEAEEMLRDRTRELERSRAVAEELAIKADAANRAKTEFLATVSHEIRTPMAAILGFTELLQEPQTTKEERTGYVQTIRRNADQLLAIIDDILDFSAIESETLCISRKTVDVVELLECSARSASTRAAEKSLEFAVEWAGSVPRQVQTDATRFRQVVQNLLSNAVKFTQAGSVKLSVDYSPEVGLRVRVIDTGIGIASSDLLRLFRPFAQVDGSMTRKFGGTGLGLAISKRLAQMLGGELTVVSKAGKGSTFSFTLPAAACDEKTLTQVAAAAEADEGVASIKGLRVLLVDDGADNRRLIGMHLKRAATVVTLAENGQQAVEAVVSAIAAGRPFDVVLLDMQMPVMDGYTAAAELRRRGIDSPVIAVTAHAGADDRQRCLDAGCDDYLTKPVDAVQLIERVAHYGASGRGAGGGDAFGCAGRALTGAGVRGQETNMLIRSDFADDPDICEILPPFIQSLAERVAEIRAVVASEDAAGLARVAHQIKGAAGGYGFPTITRLAAELEAPLKAGGTVNSVRPMADALIGEIERVEGITVWLKVA